MRKPEEFLPLSRSSYFILGSLIPGPKHGYAILKQVEELSDGEVRLAIGNLYVALKRLLDEGLIQRAGVHAQEDGERRKIYRLTALGYRVVELETERMRRAVSVIGSLEPAHGAVSLFGGLRPIGVGV